MEFFYDSQMTRYLLQIVRAFNCFSYETGARAGQPPQINVVPARMAYTDRMVAAIVQNLSTNTLLSVPMITVSHTGLTGRREDLQNPTHVSTVKVVERAIDPTTNTYTSDRGNSYTLFRLMPLPFEMTVKVDIWTSNYLQKYQLMEQILQCIYPSFDIQNSDNALDWGALSVCRVDDINWSSRSIPIGANDEIEIATITLKCDFWLTPPAKLQQQNVIEQIVVNIGDEVPTDGSIPDGSPAGLGTIYNQSIVTPGNAYIQVENGIVTLLGPLGDEVDTDPLTGSISWAQLIDHYGAFRPAVSTLTLTLGNVLDSGIQVSGTLQMNQSDPTQMMWQIDPTTLPPNTLPAVNAVIDPRRTYPSNGLPAPTEGTSYLLLNSTSPSEAWPGLAASEDDIITFTNGQWTITFDASATTQSQFVLNSYTGNQMQWTGKEWVMAIDNEYQPGFWRLHL